MKVLVAVLHFVGALVGQYLAFSIYRVFYFKVLVWALGRSDAQYWMHAALLGGLETLFFLSGILFVSTMMLFPTRWRVVRWVAGLLAFMYSLNVFGLGVYICWEWSLGSGLRWLFQLLGQLAALGGALYTIWGLVEERQ